MKQFYFIFFKNLGLFNLLKGRFIKEREREKIIILLLMLDYWKKLGKVSILR